MELKSIGKKIKNQRIRKKISQEKLAELVDVTPSYISNLESGNRVASLPTMLAYYAWYSKCFRLIIRLLNVRWFDVKFLWNKNW